MTVSYSIFCDRQQHLHHSLETCSTVTQYLWNMTDIPVIFINFPPISDFYCYLPKAVFPNVSNTCSVELSHSEAAYCSGDSCVNNILWMSSSDQSWKGVWVYPSWKLHSFSPKSKHIYSWKHAFSDLEEWSSENYLNDTRLEECWYTLLPFCLKTTQQIKTWKILTQKEYS